MPNRMVAPPDASDIIAPMPDDHIARLAQIDAARALTRSVEQMERTIKGLASEVATLNTQVAVMKQQGEKVAELKETVINHGSRIQTLELINAERKGAGGGLKSAREWMPTIVALIIAIVLLAKTGAIHL